MNQATSVRERLANYESTREDGVETITLTKRPRRMHMTDASLPKGWRMVRFRDVAESRLGKMLDQKKNKGTLQPYLRNPNVQWFEVETSDLKMMRFEEADEEKYGLVAGDVVICEGGEAGRAAIWDGSVPNMKIQKAIHRVRCSDELFNRYLVYQLKIDYESGALSEYYTGTTIKHLTGQDLAEYRFPLPPLSEQRRIAAILDAADAIRRKRQQAIALTEQFLRSTFLDMFGDPVTNPKGWPVVLMKDLFAISPNYGSMVVPNDESGEYLDLRVANIQNGVLDLASRKYVDLEPNMIERHQVLDGDILLARAIGSKEHLGKCFVAHPGSEKWAFDSHLMRIRLNLEKIHPQFLQSYLASPGGRYEFLKHTRRSAVQFNVNTKEIAKVRVPLPPIEKQSEYIAARGNTEQTKIRCCVADQKLNDLFNSLVQRAFRGEL